MIFPVNTYFATPLVPFSLKNQRVQSCSEDYVRELTERPESVANVNKFVSAAILSLDPLREEDDLWYAYHRTYEAILSGQASEAFGVYTWRVKFAGTLVDKDYGSLVTQIGPGNTLTVSGTEADILSAKSILEASGAWRAFWADPVHNPQVIRPVYEDTYTVLHWKKDRKEIMDRWGLKMSDLMYPQYQRRRDEEFMALLGQKALFDVYDALNNGTKSRVPLLTRTLLENIETEFSTRISYAGVAVDEDTALGIYSHIQSRRELGVEEYLSTVGDVFDGDPTVQMI